MSDFGPVLVSPYRSCALCGEDAPAAFRGHCEGWDCLNAVGNCPEFALPAQCWGITHADGVCVRSA